MNTLQFPFATQDWTLGRNRALALQAALLVQHAPAFVADAFCASRLAGDRGLAFGTLSRGVDCAHIIDRARPRV